MKFSDERRHRYEAINEEIVDLQKRIKALEAERSIIWDEHKREESEMRRNCSHEFRPHSYKWGSTSVRCINCGEER